MIDYESFLKLSEEKIDGYIFRLYNILNASDNYDGIYWSIPLIVENLDSGYFDIELVDEDDLYIFGINIETVDEETRKILIG